MSIRRRIGLLMFTIPLALSIMSCFGIAQITQPSPLPSPTNQLTPSPNVQPSPTVQISPTIQPPPTETPGPIFTDTPTFATSTLANTLAPPLTGQVNIVEINGFMDESDFWYFYGLVRNDTNRTIYDIQIEIRLMDSIGTEIYTYTSFTILNYLAPGETTPFSDFTTEPFPNGKTMQATVVGFNSTEAINRAKLEYRGITLWTDDKNDIYLTGEVFNINADPVEINSIAGSLVDETGKLVTASYAYPFLGYVEPNGSSPFVMVFDAPVGQADSLTNYMLYSDALTTNPTSTFDISLTEKYNKYQDTNGDTHLVGSATNNTSQPMSLYLVVGAYDENGNCIDASSIYLPLTINPGETLPYDFNLWGVLDSIPEAYNAATKFTDTIDWLSSHEDISQSSVLITKDDTHSFSGSEGTFKGTVVNNTGYDLTVAVVIVALYDKSSGELIATNYTYVTETMTNNSSGTYEVYLYSPYNIDPANVKIEITALGK